MSFYQIGILGSAKDELRTQLLSTLSEMIKSFGLQVGGGVDVLSARQCNNRNPKSAFVAIYFGGPEDQTSLEALSLLLRDNIPIIPVVNDITDFSSSVPASLRAANGIGINSAGAKLEHLCAAALECLGLLRRQRRVFLSYRRTEAAQAALQLHEVLSAKGFDVFLDTYDVRPAEDFQAVLWHRLCDCDVLVMLDTPKYFASRWTAAELGRALAKQIAILGVVWPGHTPERLAQLRESIFLEQTDLVGVDGPFTASVTTTICAAIEKLRSHSLAVRHALIAGSLRSAVESIGGTVEAIGAYRSIKVKLADERQFHIFPTVGVPTAETFNDAFDSHLAFGTTAAKSEPILVYDHVGLHQRWQKHLDWLHTNLNTIKGLQITRAAWDLADWS